VNGKLEIISEEFVKMGLLEKNGKNDNIQSTKQIRKYVTW